MLEAMRSDPFASSLRSIATVGMSLSLLTAVTGCDTLSMGMDALDKAALSRGVPDPECKREPVAVFPSAIHVHGVLVRNFLDRDRTTMNGRVLTWMGLYALLSDAKTSDPEHLEYKEYDERDVAAALVARGLDFIEIERPPHSSNPRMANAIAEIGAKVDSPFTRLTLARRGDPNCVPDVAPGMYGVGNSCVAAKGVQVPESTYSIEIVELKDEPTGRDAVAEPPALWKIVDMRTHATYAQLYRREAYYSHSCPVWPVRKRFYDLIQPWKTGTDGA